MKVYFASDHAGYELKNALIEYVRSLGYEVEDLGPHTYDANDDYPITIEPLAVAIANSEGPESIEGQEKIAHQTDVCGIIIGGSGQGEAIVANRHEGVRAIEYYGGDLEIVVLGREHNDANVLSLGARFISVDEAKQAVKYFLETPFSEDVRHVRRIKEIDK
ncbi:MAG: RpiB/LacA/LacB family sugar-phosphate isomerase [bacterium]